MHIDSQPLPQPKIVTMPEGLPNELFGDVAMVTEFIACYGELFVPDDGTVVRTGIGFGDNVYLIHEKGDLCR